jgi:hypothetical protein
MQPLHIILSFVLLWFLTACQGSVQDKAKEGQLNSQTVNNPMSAEGGKKGELPVIKFESPKADLGLIIEGEKVKHIFRFKNTGNSDLIINKVTASCGCTVPSWDKEPIPPGGEGEIEVVFNSSGRSGLQRKTVSVNTNTQPNLHKLEFFAEIVND